MANAIVVELKEAASKESVTAVNAFQSMPLNEFLKTDHALHVWIYRGERLWSRGKPGSVPYECTARLLENDINSENYWKHYGYSRYCLRASKWGDVQ